MTSLLVATLMGLGGTAAAAAPAAGRVPVPDSGPISGGTQVRVPAPEPVRFTEVRSGTIHTLALGSDGRAYAWGHNSQGQLGTGNTAPAPTPVPVAAPAGVTFTTLAAGGEFSAGLALDGAVYTWGYNSEGMIGNGTTANVNVPTRVELPGGVPAVSIAAGEYTVLALGEDGAVYGWGRNSAGGLGIGAAGRPELSPVAAVMPEGVAFTGLSASNYHALAVTADGRAYGWGRNDDGELGQGTASSARVTTPQLVTMPAGVGFTSVSAGGSYSVGVGDDGAVYTWGHNARGQLGNGTKERSLIPIPADTPDGVSFAPATAAPADPDERAGRGASAGGYHVLGLGSDGEAYTWGRNDEGQLGTGTQDESALPVRVHRPEGVQFAQVDTGAFSSVALSDTGTAYTWGYNPLGQAGNPEAPRPLVLEPLPVAMDSTVTSVAFDGSDGTELTQQEGGDWSAVTPEHEAGPVDVVVSWTQFGIEREPVTYADGFTYIGPGLAVTGVKRIGDVAHAAPGLPAAAPSTWEITATQGDDVRVVSGGDAVVLPAGRSYALGERVNADAPQAELAGRYAQSGDVVCVDGEGAALPESVFDPATGALTVPHAEEALAEIPAPVTCEVTNQTAHASFVTRSGEDATAVPGAGWGLALDHAEETADTDLGAAAASAVVLPGNYGLTATVPASMQFAGIDRLSNDTDACVDAALDPTTAPEACWARLSAATSAIPQGEHTVFRVTATVEDGGGTTPPTTVPPTTVPPTPGPTTTGPTTTGPTTTGPTTPPTPTAPPTGGGTAPLATTGGTGYTPLLLAAAAAALGGLALWRRGRTAAEVRAD